MSTACARVQKHSARSHFCLSWWLLTGAARPHMPSQPHHLCRVRGQTYGTLSGDYSAPLAGICHETRRPYPPEPQTPYYLWSMAVGRSELC